MFLPKTKKASPVGALFVLGRVTNLPTVWSNCLAAWLLAGGGELGRLAWAALGGSFLYLGGVYLNDYFDADFDRRFRQERVIPSGRLGARAVWRLGWLWLLFGIGVLIGPAGASVVATLGLVTSIIVYNLVHKATQLSPMLIGGCRFLLYLIAASVGKEGISGLAIWSGLALGAYVAGLGYLARKESTRAPFSRWPLVLMATPVGLAWIVNVDEYFHIAAWLSLLLGLWVFSCLRHALRGSEPNVGLSVAGLIAGIVLVDLLAVAGHSPGVVLVFLTLFLASILGQRYTPAT